MIRFTLSKFVKTNACPLKLIHYSSSIAHPSNVHSTVSEPITHCHLTGNNPSTSQTVNTTGQGSVVLSQTAQSDIATKANQHIGNLPVLMPSQYVSKKFMCCVDGSLYASNALQTILSFLRNQDELILFTVAPRVEIAFSQEIDIDEIRKRERVQTERVKKFLDAEMNVCKQAQVKNVSFIVAKDSSSCSVKHAIVEFAKVNSVEFIVMGYRGLGLEYESARMTTNMPVESVDDESEPPMNGDLIIPPTRVQYISGMVSQEFWSGRKYRTFELGETTQFVASQSHCSVIIVKPNHK
jgi:hypothetical protein